MSIYSLCSDHWTHIRMPSSKNVDTRHKRAKCGRTCFDERVTLSAKSSAFEIHSFCPALILILEFDTTSLCFVILLLKFVAYVTAFNLNL